MRVSWSESPQPVEGTDYTVTTASPASVDYPDVELIEESLTWRIFSTDTDNPGDIGVIRSPYPENFGVKIEDATAGPGARDLKGIILDPTSATKHSNITGGEITGSLLGSPSGGLLVQQASGGTGGDVDFTIGGDVDGDIVAAVITGTLWVVGDLSADITVSDEVKGGTLGVSGDVTSGSVIEVADMVSDGAVHSELAFYGSTSAAFAGRLDLLNGVRENQKVRFYDPFTGTMDLKTKPYKGTLYLKEGGSGDIINGGALDSPAVSLAEGAGTPGSFSGSATFASVASGTNISMGYTDLEGKIHITGEMAGLIRAYKWVVSPYQGGSLVAPDGAITIGGVLSGSIMLDKDLDGPIVVDSMSGSISVDRDMIAGNREASIRVFEDMSTTADISVGGDGSTILVYGDIEGDITIGGNMCGNIYADADGKSGGTITSNASVTVDGTFSGDVCDDTLVPGEDPLPTQIDITTGGGTGRTPASLLRAHLGMSNTG